MKLLSADQLQQIESHLGNLLDRVFSAEGLAPVNEIIRRYVRAGGKRIRPQLCVWTYHQAAGGSTANDPQLPAASRPLPAPLLDLACAWELFHAFLLAHDDIIDSADQRRDQPSLHRQLAALDGDAPQFGINLGIVAGDLMFSAAMRLWHEVDLPAEMYRRQLRLFSRVACTTGFGQAIDICQSHADLDAVDEQTLLREYHWKTAAYTFEGPMLSGAMLAGADADAQGAISRFALALGQAYQLQNDLLDLSQPMHPGSDLVQGKRTVVLIHARAAMPAEQRRRFDRQLHSLRDANGQAGRLAESLRQDMRECGALEQTRRIIERFITSAQHAASDSAIPPSLAQALSALLESLREQYFTPLADSRR